MNSMQAESTYVVAIPCDGLVQGDCMGLLFCYSGPDSDLPVSEILFFPSTEEAQELISALQAIADLHPATTARFKAARIICVRGPSLACADVPDLVSLGASVAAEPQPPYVELEISKEPKQ